MFVDTIVIGIFFKILNFAIIIGCTVYLFKYYAQDSLQQMRDEKEDEFKRLRAQKVDVRRHNKNLDVQLEEQQELCKRLKHNVSIWKKIVLQQKEDTKRERQVMYNQMEHIRLLQGRAITLSKLEHTVMPIALKKARQQLEKKFASEKQGQEFIKALLNDMQKGAQ